MSVKLSRTALDMMADVMITGHDPHCIGWACAMASLWGHDDSHDLDEAVRLTDELPVRLRYKDWDGFIVTDRELTLKTIRRGTHVGLRFYFKNGKYWETPVEGVYAIGHGAKTVSVKGMTA